MKQCRKCLELKDDSEFNTNKRMSDGLQSYCKSCMYQTGKDWSKKHKKPRQSKFVFEDGKPIARICSICKQPIPLERMGRNKNLQYGVSSSCKDCVNKKHTPKQRQSARTRGFKTCKTCQETLPIDQFYPHGEYFDSECKKCYNIHMSEYKRTHKESVNETARKYRLNPSFIAKREASKDTRLKYTKPTLTNVCAICLKSNPDRICPKCKNSMKHRIKHERVHMRKTHPCPICSKPIISLSDHPDCKREHNRQRNKYNYNNNPAYRERVLSSASEYQKANRDKIREKERLYRKEHPEKVRAKEKNREYRERGAEGSYTHTEWTELTNKYQGRCVRCHSKPDHLTVDHVVPISLKGTNYIFNLQPLCVSCNSKKSAKMTDYRTEIWIQGIPVMSLPLVCCLFYVWDKVFWHNESEV